MPGIEHFFTKTKAEQSPYRVEPSCDEDKNDDDDDDDVIIIEDSRSRKRKNNSTIRNYSKPTDALKNTEVSKIVAKTPTVPRINGSMLNKKCKDCPKGGQPPTPATPKPTRQTPLRNRPRSGAKQTNSSGRSTKSKPNHNESIASDYSTPKTTRNLSTPKSTTCMTLKSGKRISHLIYRPLELDNESSSESSDCFMRRRRSTNSRRVSQEMKTPLAIEAPTNSRSSEKFETCDTNHISANDNGKKAASSVIESDFKEDGAKRRRLDDPSTECLVSERDNVDELSQCMTPPITPEKSKEEDIPMFIPGTCNIDDVLRIYGSAKKNSQADVNEQKQEI